METVHTDNIIIPSYLANLQYILIAHGLFRATVHVQYTVSSTCTHSQRTTKVIGASLNPKMKYRNLRPFEVGNRDVRIELESQMGLQTTFLLVEAPRQFQR